MQIRDKEYWDDLLIDCFSNDITDDNRAVLNKWLDESEKHRLYYESMKDIWNASSVADDQFPFDYEKAFILFERRIHSANGQKIKHSMPLWRKAVAVAAVLIPFILLSYYTILYFNIQSSRDEGLVLSEITSPNGSKTKLKLADGTVVWLNSGSTVRYNNGFGKDNRQLLLSGEAYLEVERNEKLPFVVKTKEVDVVVLGTVFNVNAYPENEDVKVSLLNGSVSLSKDGSVKPIILKPMETGVYNRMSGQIIIDHQMVANALSWINGRLVFNGETFEEITKILERNFNVKIVIHDENLKKKRFGGDFRNNKSIEEILEIMSSSGKFKYKTTNDRIDIY
ncbi:FecR family protein [Parabacteroides chinchillae]